MAKADANPARQTSANATHTDKPGALPISGSDNAIRILATPTKLPAPAEQAYQAFNREEYDLAQATWQQVLQADARNLDALHGLAAIAQMRQQPDRASELYLRALEADPKDAFAYTALASLKGQVDPQVSESRLKHLLLDQPDSPYLNFALGNIYAKMSRWADAQQAYFKALAADPGNPDYLFNLAVSLDQLHQTRLAAQYYNQAQSAASQRQASFDPTQVATRLKSLQP
jgi:tetratricopeptide (TPR) repeat protein